MLEVRSAGVRYGVADALVDVSVTVPDGAVVAVLGPSGSGKTTLLRAVAGLEPLTTGTVVWDGADLTAVPVHRRGFGLMFQDHALFGHLDVLANVTFGLRMHGAPKTERAVRATEMLALVGLADLAHRRVDGLSGGEQQRVALARALAPRPRLLMLDEPLASVDRERREQLAVELHRAIRTTGTATLLVTHDLDEAFTLADHIVLLDRGRVIQTGPAVDVWRAPASVTAARFLGVDTGLVLTASGGRVVTPWGERTATVPDGAVWAGWRPADLALTAGTGVPATVGGCWFRRDHYLVQVDTALGPMTVRSDAPAAIGDRVCVSSDPGAAVVLPA